jgi:phage repressor protein C with HTH and peptisase S24 domain
MSGTDPRAALERLIQERGEDYASLSRLIGRNAAYVQQYVKRGTPKHLGERDRRLLARYFGVSEKVLGGPQTLAGSEDAVQVPRLGVEASAGPGAVDPDERSLGAVAFDPRWLRRIGGGEGRGLSLIEVRGDSMAPLLEDGDEILVDTGDTMAALRDGVYVLRRDDALLVKRLSRHPGGRRLSVTSDNPAHPSWPDCDPGEIELVGRVIWAGKRIR